MPRMAMGQPNLGLGVTPWQMGRDPNELEYLRQQELAQKLAVLNAQRQSDSDKIAADLIKQQNALSSDWASGARDWEYRTAESAADRAQRGAMQSNEYRFRAAQAADERAAAERMARMSDDLQRGRMELTQQYNREGMQNDWERMQAGFGQSEYMAGLSHDLGMERDQQANRYDLDRMDRASVLQDTRDMSTYIRKTVDDKENELIALRNRVDPMGRSKIERRLKELSVLRSSNLRPQALAQVGSKWLSDVDSDKIGAFYVPEQTAAESVSSNLVPGPWPDTYFLRETGSNGQPKYTLVERPQPKHATAQPKTVKTPLAQQMMEPGWIANPANSAKAKEYLDQADAMLAAEGVEVNDENKYAKAEELARGAAMRYKKAVETPFRQFFRYIAENGETPEMSDKIKQVVEAAEQKGLDWMALANEEARGVAEERNAAAQGAGNPDLGAFRQFFRRVAVEGKTPELSSALPGVVAAAEQIGLDWKKMAVEEAGRLMAEAEEPQFQQEPAPVVPQDMSGQPPAAPVQSTDVTSVSGSGAVKSASRPPSNPWSMAAGSVQSAGGKLRGDVTSAQATEAKAFLDSMYKKYPDGRFPPSEIEKLRAAKKIYMQFKGG